MRNLLMVPLLLVVLALSACNTPAPTAPCSVTISKQAAEQLLLRARQAYMPGKPLTLNASNQEVTSLLGQYMEQLKTENPNDFIPLESPIVCFDTGKASVFGKFNLGKDNPVAALITLSATVSAGKPVFKVEQIQLGPVPVPPNLREELTRAINRLVTEYLGPVSVTEIRLTPGQIVISGQLRN